MQYRDRPERNGFRARRARRCSLGQAGRLADDEAEHQPTPRGIAELIRGVGVLVPDPSPVAFARAIDETVGNAQLLRALGNASADRARAYSWDAAARAVDALYRQIRV